MPYSPPQYIASPYLHLQSVKPLYKTSIYIPGHQFHTASFTLLALLTPSEEEQSHVLCLGLKQTLLSSIQIGRLKVVELCKTQ